VKVAILIPTRVRPGVLDLCLKTIARNTEYKDYFVQVVFDGDLPGYESLDTNYHGIEVRKHCLLKQCEYVAAANRAYSLNPGADLFVNWSDDSMCTPGWLTKAVERFKEVFPEGCGVVSMNHYWGDKLCTHGLFDRKFVKALGYINPKAGFLHTDFVHYGSDDYLTLVAKDKGLFYYAEDIKVYHPTPAETKGNPSMIYKDQDGVTWRRLKKEYEGTR
jgi:hypothetical protein